MQDVVRQLARELAMLSAEVARLRRQQANIIRPGIVEDVRPGEYRGRVRLAEGEDGTPFLSPWRPWAAVAGGKAQDWTALEKGQQVLLFSPMGAFGQSLILPLGFSDEVPPPSTSGDERLMRFGDSVFAMGDKVQRFEAESLRFIGELRLGAPDAGKRVMLEDGSPASKVYAV